MKISHFDILFDGLLSLANVEQQQKCLQKFTFTSSTSLTTYKIDIS